MNPPVGRSYRLKSELPAEEVEGGELEEESDAEENNSKRVYSTPQAPIIHELGKSRHRNSSSSSSKKSCPKRKLRSDGTADSSDDDGTPGLGCMGKVYPGFA